MSIGESIHSERLERRIGYHFHEPGLLTEALTHTSYANEHRKARIRHNERLEFLGDAVLETVSSEFLFKKFPEKDEGALSKLRASMVCEPSLAKCARDLELPSFIRLGKGEEKNGGRGKDSIVSDAMEALIGAVYLDGGFEAAKRIVQRFILQDLRQEDLFVDSKTRLQEIVQENGGVVAYEVADAYGPDHNRSFMVRVLINGKETATGYGHTKKAAEQNAAEQALLCI